MVLASSLKYSMTTAAKIAKWVEGGGWGVERPYHGYRNQGRRPFETFELGMQPKEEPTPQAA